MSYSIIDLFRANANPEQAIPMTAYLKNQFPFLGIQKPLRSQLQKAYIRELAKQPLLDETWIRTLWQQPEREFKYLAVDILQAKKDQLTPDHLPLIEYLITTESWWDSVDLLASNVFGLIAAKYPAVIQSHVIPWANLNLANIWLARTAILTQLKWKSNTDTALLEQVIVRNKDTKEFFLNKAIGWALREYAKTNPDYVLHFVKTHRLHALATREATKHL
jgi:3-methyladenine DNA glycosylase AlkD